MQNTVITLIARRLSSFHSNFNATSIYQGFFLLSLRMNPSDPSYKARKAAYFGRKLTKKKRQGAPELHAEGKVYYVIQ